MADSLKPDKILKELGELWTTMSKPEPGEGTPEGGVLRACAMTLIAIVDDADDSQDLGETLASLMKDHPSRAIVIRLAEKPDILEGRVFAQCWMPFGHRRQICCEQVEITVSANRLEDIPPIVSPITVPDLPCTVWVKTASMPESAAAQKVLALGNRIILDSNRAGKAGIATLRKCLDRGFLVGDLAWTRITEVRELLAQMIEGVRLEQIESAAVDYCSAQPTADVLYLAGWIESIYPGRRVALRHVEGSGNIREVRIEPGIQVNLSGGCADFRLGRLKEHASFHGGGDYDLLNEELRIAVHDRVFERVLRQVT